jgi:hypothetical protein
MQRFRLIPICAAVLALTLVPALSARQTEPATGTPSKMENKARTKAKRMTEEGTPTVPESPKSRARTSVTGSAQRSELPVSESEISAARASGKVWVNTSTGVYHKGGPWYGATKQGKFMTEDAAKSAGYRLSKSK